MKLRPAPGADVSGEPGGGGTNPGDDDVADVIAGWPEHVHWGPTIMAEAGAPVIGVNQDEQLRR